ncbi:hypothetical protein AO501_23720 [Mycobacterium gordonae]|uniref:DUF4345 domain-containing protein n=1 Tax=Mycobacterium gordonae TaxID=1778 RepID=A0A0Q2LPZ7_MYCGO|nr:MULTISPECIES: DUF4345 domain-containing protein [Mycobacterium]KQH77722.1 hypothetical protein AO501_23720 [Mycobacterium gordonae]MDP7729625.1 DUF4345 domain-containing protein [Mycobacterium sp. TY813]
MATAVSAFAAVFFLGMGLYALAAPARMIQVFGITLPTRESRSEVRAVYGGFGVAIAGVLAFAALQPSPARTGVMITVGLALAGMAFGRLVSAVIDGRTPFYPNWFYFIVEAVVGGALLLTAAG